jgi:putative tryptophan/tyrosine transport system substrate-binding protein
MRRRDVIALVGGAAAWPLAARAQQHAVRLPTIGFLGQSTAENWTPWTAAFVRRLHELDWIEGRTVAIEYRWSHGRTDLFAEFAAEFVRRRVDVIVSGGVGALAAKQLTATIPIVFAVAVDPVGSGIVTSLARPGANLTGLSIQAADLAGKRLEILRELLPGLQRLAIVANTSYPGARSELSAAREAAQALGLEASLVEILRAEDIAPAFERATDRAQAVYVCPDPLVNANHAHINALALHARLPTIHALRDFLDPGGFLSYGVRTTDLFRRAADFVDKILRGAHPGDLPVEQPTKFELTVNLKTAKALGLTIPETFLARADEVIE